MRYLQSSWNKAEAVSNVVDAELELEAAELGDKKDTEYFKLQTSKAEADFEVMEAKEMLMNETEL
jgi:hypothetical protein